mmetsp:Transcript_12986/g.17386  ORF Transcript_12986/g.17386 Transcript_12986/m.17386 type:complete len:216 (+) Transcript_12986:49-696(+)|eukprot:CAMPEP_0197291160 /NCGR_PEP_ID=MMETSP0890-20130614/11715_1 /TAXON_ID=44058 ORGANISM="Aureoumbra lagunensis, Strain CCMP1510" /NCGR_SAMPLE_ID=MMETSP0890 /ASSEMBLY_ACC=CAM_ASM_000533 /LENGTH=215 /DNA_ID=CAMNT_0042763779 /DNA_START=49 /DNA_END=696 /DNA_ORIENTATION=-
MVTAKVPEGALPQEEMSPEEMQELCSVYTKTYDGHISPMWKATFDGNLKAMKALYYFYRKEPDGFGACNREDRSMPSHIAALRGHTEILEWLASLHWYDGRFVTNFNTRDDGGHTPLWLAAAWGWNQCVDFLLSLPQVHPTIPDNDGFTPEQAARRVGYNEIAQAIYIRAKELNVVVPENSYWDEPDKRWYIKKAEESPDQEQDDEEDDDDEEME